MTETSTGGPPRNWVTQDEYSIFGVNPDPAQKNVKVLHKQRKF